MSDESIALAMPCTFEFVARDPGTGDLEVTWENDLQAVVIRTDNANSYAPALVALISATATPQPFFAAYPAGIVSTPVGEFNVGEFQMLFFRCDAEGGYVGNFLDPAWMQMRDATAAGAAAHVDDIASLIDARRNGDAVVDQIDWRLFDIGSSGETDGLSADEALARARFRNDAPLHLVHGLQGLASLKMMQPELASILGDEEPELFPVADLVLEDWFEIRSYPTYLIDGVRALFRRFLADRIGETPIEGIVRIQHAPGMANAISNVFEQEGFDELEPSAPFADDRMMRGAYATSEVRNFRGNGVDIIVFEDFAGSYAYAWPEQPTLTHGNV
jgi:hypothetical protein